MEGPTRETHSLIDIGPKKAKVNLIIKHIIVSIVLNRVNFIEIHFIIYYC